MISEFRAALNYIEETISELRFEITKPSQKIAATMLNIALDHAQGICILLEKAAYPSAVAMLRVQFEAYIRASWLGYCASDAQIQSFISNDEIRNDGKKIEFAQLVSLVEANAELGSFLTIFRQTNMKSFHSFTHGGVHQLFHYVNGDMITHRYEKSDIDGLCKGAAMIACMTYVTLLDVVEKAKAEALAEHLLEMVTPWLFNQK